jgi:hypothetical protein
MAKRGNSKTKFQQRLARLTNKTLKVQAAEGDEGKFSVHFVFDGIHYTREHSCTAFEVQHMKELAKEHGDLAADQLVWKMMAKGASLVSEALIGQAGNDYVQKHFVPKMGTAIGGSNETSNPGTSPSNPAECSGIPEHSPDESPVGIAGERPADAQSSEGISQTPNLLPGDSPSIG